MAVKRDGRGRRGPAWLGIGAQRSGTTWFTDLLLQHPDVTLSNVRAKELRWMNRAPNRPFDAEEYISVFDVDGHPGEFTPMYLRALWVPERAREVIEPET